jgi:hypothetical protein
MLLALLMIAFLSIPFEKDDNSNATVIAALCVSFGRVQLLLLTLLPLGVVLKTCVSGRDTSNVTVTSYRRARSPLPTITVLRQLISWVSNPTSCLKKRGSEGNIKHCMHTFDATTC